MSRYVRPLHKFITKPVRPKNFLINPVTWLPKTGTTHIPLKQRGSQRWEIFAQRTITINPKETETLVTGLGVRMTRGWCGVTLRQEIQSSGCVVQGGGIVAENMEDIVVTILNDSDSIVTILEGDPLCFVHHTVGPRPTS
jgi:dUTPase